MVIEKFNMPQMIEGDNFMLVRRIHDYDKQMWETIDNNRNFLSRFLPWVENTKSFDDVVEATKIFEEKWKSFVEQAYLIVDKNTKELLGCVAAHNIDFYNQKAEIGYWLREDKTGFGYITKVVKLLENELFLKEIHRLTICCNINNHSSANVAIRNGYKFESFKVDSLWTKDGFCNEEIYVKINPNQKLI